MSSALTQQEREGLNELFGEMTVRRRYGRWVTFNWLGKFRRVFR